MFRKMRRGKQQTDETTCIEILKKQMRGVLSVLGDDDYPYGIPMDYVYDEESGRIYFHGAREGHKIDSIRRHDKVCFTVWNEGYRREGEWALNITSVIAFGHIHEIEDHEEVLRRALQLGLKYCPTREEAEEETRRAGGRVAVLEMVIDHMTGKLVNES